MPRQQRFEGDALEVVLERVRNEAGAGAKVLEAKKVRDGGVAGFFSKEKFVLTVEVPDAPRKLSKKALAAAAKERAAIQTAPGADPMIDAVAPPSSILEMVDVVDEAELRIATPIVPPAAPKPAPAPMAPPIDFEALDPPVVLAETPRVVHEPVERPAPPIPSTETASFQDVLRRLAAEADDVADIDIIDTDTSITDIIDTTPAPVAEAQPVIEMQIPTEVTVTEPESDETPVPTPIAIAAEEADLLPVVPVSPALVERARRTPSTFERTVGLQLLELGVPAAYVPEIEGAYDADAIHAALVRTMQLPPPPALPRRSGAVIAVVGEKRAAMKLAELLAAEPAMRGAAVQLADKDGITTTGAKPSASARGQRQRPSKRIVAVPSSPGATSEWAQELLDGLEPDMVWGIVPADRKSEDVAAWAVGVGGLDVLALTNLDKTVSPATVLRLGIPVGLLDWKLATPDAWADLLTDRLAA